MGYKVCYEPFIRDLCNTIDKTDKKSIYHLFSRKSNGRRREFKQRIRKDLESFKTSGSSRSILSISSDSEITTGRINLENNKQYKRKLE